MASVRSAYPFSPSVFLYVSVSSLLPSLLCLISLFSLAFSLSLAHTHTHTHTSSPALDCLSPLSSPQQ